jgi:hypothetical protein
VACGTLVVMAAPTPPPWTLARIENVLRDSWAADTCSPDDLERDGWHSGNPAWGHCDITALVVNDIFGGDLMLGEVWAVNGERHGYHWWNLLGTGVELDLTREQFRCGQVVTGARVVKRPAGPLPRRGNEYALLRDRVAARLGAGPAPAPAHRKTPPEEG